MKFYVRTSYYDEPADLETFDSPDEAGECFRATVDQRRDCGAACGDVARISTGIQSADGKFHVRGSVSFD